MMLVASLLLLACGGVPETGLPIYCAPGIIGFPGELTFHWDQGCWSDEMLCLNATYWQDMPEQCGLDNGPVVYAFGDGQCFKWGSRCSYPEALPFQDPNLYLWYTDAEEVYDACYAFFDAYLNGKKDTYPECE